MIWNSLLAPDLFLVCPKEAPKTANYVYWSIAHSCKMFCGTGPSISSITLYIQTILVRDIIIFKKTLFFKNIFAPLNSFHRDNCLDIERPRLRLNMGMT